MGNRILFVQTRIQPGTRRWSIARGFLPTVIGRCYFSARCAHGAGALEFPPHLNIEVRRWKFAPAGLWQKLHFFAFNDWVLITALWWKPKWIYASDVLACPIALVLKSLGFRVLYHEHDSPNPEVRGQREVPISPVPSLGEEEIGAPLRSVCFA